MQISLCSDVAVVSERVIKSSLDNYLGLYDRIGMQSSLGHPNRSRDSRRSRSAAPPAGCIRICASTAACRY